MNDSFIKTLFLAVVLAFYSFFGIKYWLNNQKKIADDWIKLGASLLVAAALVFGPMILLMTVADGLGQHEKLFVVLVWILPSLICHGYAALKEHRRR